MPANKNVCVDVFLACCTAMRKGVLIHRVSKQDKEFHFQDWFGARLGELNCPYDAPERNTYPDFRLVQVTEGYEIKALAYPGREANYDSNSQVPTGHHNGRTIYYVFGRYPKDSDDADYPVIDLVVCHGDFLNADHGYIHKNKSVKGFGSYGDIMIRDRKMYVAPTPFALTTGTTGQQTIILPKSGIDDKRLAPVGELVRTESEKLVVGYSFDLKNNTIKPELIDNPGAGQKHEFVAYRSKDGNGPEVALKAAVLEDSTNNEGSDSTVPE